jgi:hypothetical protein
LHKDGYSKIIRDIEDVSHQKDAKVFIASGKLRPCNTSEMTLGRVLWLALGILFDSE